jgi:hypothetical protein
MRVRCVSPYRSSLGGYRPGDEIEGSLAAALIIDSPGSFEDMDAPTLEVAAPAEPDDHRAVLRPTRRARA